MKISEQGKVSNRLRIILFKYLKENCVAVSVIENKRSILCIPVDKKAYTTILKSGGVTHFHSFSANHKPKKKKFKNVCNESIVSNVFRIPANDFVMR